MMIGSFQSVSSILDSMAAKALSEEVGLVSEESRKKAKDIDNDRYPEWIFGFGCASAALILMGVFIHPAMLFASAFTVYFWLRFKSTYTEMVTELKVSVKRDIEKYIERQK